MNKHWCPDYSSGLKRESCVNQERARRCNRGRLLQYVTALMWEDAAYQVDPGVRRPASAVIGFFGVVTGSFGA